MSAGARLPVRSLRAAAVAMATLLAAAVGAAVGPAEPAEQVPIARVESRPRLDVDVWINKDEGGVFRPSERMRVYFRASADAYVLVYNVDTEGYIHLIYPYRPSDPPYVDGGRSYSIPSRRDPYDLVADGPPGIEYVVAVASPFPFRNLPWYLSRDRADGEAAAEEEESEEETDLGYIVGDPYVGIDRINRRICPPGREDQVATSETYFYIERRVEYPRYVCADCHFGHPYFDPFVTACTVVDIRIDATWARYAPIRLGTVRPRYFYRIRSQAPTRYRAWKEQWSSLDGRATLRSRFLPGSDVRLKPGRAPLRRTVPPEFRDLRRERSSRFWRGRDVILKLREERREDARARREARERENDAVRERGRVPQRGERVREKSEASKDEKRRGKVEERRGKAEERREKPEKGREKIEERRDKEERRPDSNEKRRDDEDRLKERGRSRGR